MILQCAVHRKADEVTLFDTNHRSSRRGEGGKGEGDGHSRTRPGSLGVNASATSANETSERKNHFPKGELPEGKGKSHNAMPAVHGIL